MISNFNTLAIRNHDRFSFGIVPDVHLAKSGGSVPVPSVVCYNNVDGEHAVLPGASASSIVELAKFIETASKPLIGDMTRRNEINYFKVPLTSFPARPHSLPLNVAVIIRPTPTTSNLFFPVRKISNLHLRPHPHRAIRLPNLSPPPREEIPRLPLNRHNRRWRVWRDGD